MESKLHDEKRARSSLEAQLAQERKSREALERQFQSMAKTPTPPPPPPPPQINHSHTMNMQPTYANQLSSSSRSNVMPQNNSGIKNANCNNGFVSLWFFF